MLQLVIQHKLAVACVLLVQQMAVEATGSAATEKSVLVDFRPQLVAETNLSENKLVLVGRLTLMTEHTTIFGRFAHTQDDHLLVCINVGCDLRLSRIELQSSQTQWHRMDAEASMTFFPKVYIHAKSSLVLELHLALHKQVREWATISFTDSENQRSRKLGHHWTLEDTKKTYGELRSNDTRQKPLRYVTFAFTLTHSGQNQEQTMPQSIHNSNQNAAFCMACTAVLSMLCWWSRDQHAIRLLVTAVVTVCVAFIDYVLPIDQWLKHTQLFIWTSLCLWSCACVVLCRCCYNQINCTHEQEQQQQQCGRQQHEKRRYESGASSTSRSRDNISELIMHETKRRAGARSCTTNRMLGRNDTFLSVISFATSSLSGLTDSGVSSVSMPVEQGSSVNDHTEQYEGNTTCHTYEFDHNQHYNAQHIGCCGCVKSVMFHVYPLLPSIDRALVCAAIVFNVFMMFCFV